MSVRNVWENVIRSVATGSVENKLETRYWTPQTVVVEDAQPTKVVLTSDKANTNLIASDFTIAGFTVSSLARDATNKILTLTLSTAVIYGDVLNVVIKGKSYSVTNNVALNTSYDNAGGKGDRRSVITITQSGFTVYGSLTELVDGLTDSGEFWMGAAPVSGNWILFDFGSDASMVINEAKLYQSSARSHGTFQWQGSNDDSATPSNFTNIGSPFTLGNDLTLQTISTGILTENTEAYRHYRLLGISGNWSGDPYVYEIEFKIQSVVLQRMLLSEESEFFMTEAGDNLIQE